jgi:hypothetical protein
MDLNKELAYAGIWVSAQIGIGIVAWVLLGGASLTQLVEAGLVALVPMATIFFVRERRFQVSGGETKFARRKMGTKVSLLWLVVVSILGLYSFIVPDAYAFNLSMYVTALGFSAGLEVWLAWGRFKAQKSHS